MIQNNQQYLINTAYDLGMLLRILYNTNLLWKHHNLWYFSICHYVFCMYQLIDLKCNYGKWKPYATDNWQNSGAFFRVCLKENMTGHVRSAYYIRNHRGTFSFTVITFFRWSRHELKKVMGWVMQRSWIGNRSCQ